jgi:hypothetical protein
MSRRSRHEPARPRGRCAAGADAGVGRRLRGERTCQAVIARGWAARRPDRVVWQLGLGPIRRRPGSTLAWRSSSSPRRTGRCRTTVAATRWPRPNGIAVGHWNARLARGGPWDAFRSPWRVLSSLIVTVERTGFPEPRLDDDLARALRPLGGLRHHRLHLRALVRVPRRPRTGAAGVQGDDVLYASRPGRASFGMARSPVATPCATSLSSALPAPDPNRPPRPSLRWSASGARDTRHATTHRRWHRTVVPAVGSAALASRRIAG